MKPAPAMLMSRMMGWISEFMWSTIILAMFCGAIRACFASPNAIGVAISPCSGVLVGENGIVGTSDIASSPASMAAWIALSKILWISVFIASIGKIVFSYQL